MVRVLTWTMAMGLVGSVLFASMPVSAQDNTPSPAQEAAKAQADDEARMKAAAKVLQRSLDAARARDFEGWVACFSPDVIIRSSQMHINNRKELRAIYRVFFDANLPDPEILESGWTGKRVWVRQREFFAKGGPSLVSYAEYEVQGGLITAVYAHAE